MLEIVNRTRRRCQMQHAIQRAIGENVVRHIMPHEAERRIVEVASINDNALRHRIADAIEIRAMLIPMYTLQRHATFIVWPVPGVQNPEPSAFLFETPFQSIWLGAAYFWFFAVTFAGREGRAQRSARAMTFAA